MSTFLSDEFTSLIEIFSCGLGLGFTIGFIAWGVGFGFYALIKWFKMS